MQVALCETIRQAIRENGGRITFADYMARCLYTPELGYYSGGKIKLGAAGDFTTAPEQSDLFSRSLARQIMPVLAQLEHGDVLEFGAGSGKMAAFILEELNRSECLPQKYFILETSPDLQQQQRQTLATLTPDLWARVEWISSLPDSFIGVILANEVCDAMPVHCLQLDENGISELYVQQTENGDFDWQIGEIGDATLLARAKTIHTLAAPKEAYRTEVNLAAEGWLASLADCLQQGAIFIIDYGYPQATYYHPQRGQGTLMCYFQHQGHDDPFINPGLQDMTAHVDFTALAEVAQQNGLAVAGFQSQADFLLAGGLLALVSEVEQTNPETMLQRANEIKLLTLPSEMGESFKALTLTLGLPELLHGVKQGDRRYSL